MQRNKLVFYIGFVSALFLLTITACTTNTAASQSSTALEATSALPAASEANSASTAIKLNLNSATADEFLSIPEVGNRMVREFQEYRPYSSILQFRREIGKYVSDDQVAEYEKYVFVPISINDADAETLQQISGLDDSEAQALMDARPFASSEDFRAKLLEYVSADELAIAITFLDTK